MKYQYMIFSLLSFIIGSLITILIFFIKKKIKGTRKKIGNVKGIFDLNPYSSQQLSKLIGERILKEEIIKNNLTSINPTQLPLQFCSQWCEDIFLYTLFNKKKKGFYIEIGAFNGVKLSNTYFFESIGWTGILVEPQPKQFDQLIINRPNSICANVCISMHPHDMVLNIVEDVDYETWSYIERKENHSLRINFTTNKITVPCKKINDLIPDDVHLIDFLSIDVEGMELEVLMTIDLEKYCPKIILIENPDEAISNYLLDYGYKPIRKTWINYFYSKETVSHDACDIFQNLGITING